MGKGAPFGRVGDASAPVPDAAIGIEVIDWLTLVELAVVVSTADPSLVELGSVVLVDSSDEVTAVSVRVEPSAVLEGVGEGVGLGESFLVSCRALRAYRDAVVGFEQSRRTASATRR